MTVSGYLYIDANTVSYALDAGGTAVLDTFVATAEANGYTLAVTDMVAQEIENGPRDVVPRNVSSLK